MQTGNTVLRKYMNITVKVCLHRNRNFVLTNIASTFSYFMTVRLMDIVPLLAKTIVSKNFKAYEALPYPRYNTATAKLKLS